MYVLAALCPMHRAAAHRVVSHLCYPAESVGGM